MKIAVISDIHENRDNLEEALKRIREAGAEKVICLGDIVSPVTARLLAESGIPSFSLWGNNDGEKVALMRLSMEEGSGLAMSGKSHDFLDIDGRKLFLTHFDDLSGPMARSGDYDAVFYGHNHDRSKERVNDCLLLNPGELSAQKTGIASFAIYDTASNEAEIIEWQG